MIYIQNDIGPFIMMASTHYANHLSPLVCSKINCSLCDNCFLKNVLRKVPLNTKLSTATIVLLLC